MFEGEVVLVNRTQVVEIQQQFFDPNHRGGRGLTPYILRCNGYQMSFRRLLQIHILVALSADAAFHIIMG